MPYIVQKGDTLAKIAKKIYGDMNRWSEIKDLSALHNPNRIYPGDVVYYALTAESTSFAQAYELSPKSEVTVQQGQTLANIAAQVYGDSTTWKMIWRLNGHIANPDQLEVGTIVHYLDQSVLISQNDLDEPVHSVLEGKDSFVHQGQAGIKGFSQLQQVNTASEFVML
jgi:nucleoid-associated protein YgaU